MVQPADVAVEAVADELPDRREHPVLGVQRRLVLGAGEVFGEVPEQRFPIGGFTLLRGAPEYVDLRADFLEFLAAEVVGGRELAGAAQRVLHRVPRVRWELAGVADEDALLRAQHQHQRLRWCGLARLLQDRHGEAQKPDFGVAGDA